MIKVLLVLLLVVYVLGFAGMFAMHTQMPVTFGLALARSALWPLSLATGREWPRGVRLETYCPPDPDECG